jgi:hypothetical protein
MGINLTDMDGKDISPRQFIGNDERSLKGMIKTTKDGISLVETTETGEEIAYKVNNPRYFSYVVKAITAMAHGVHRM